MICKYGSCNNMYKQIKHDYTMFKEGREETSETTETMLVRKCKQIAHDHEFVMEYFFVCIVVQLQIL